MNKVMWLCPQCADMLRDAFEVRRMDGNTVRRKCDQCRKPRYVSRVRVSTRRR